MEHVPNTSDAELIQRFLDGEMEAFAWIVKRHEDYVYNAVIYMTGDDRDAEDITQEVFLKAYRGIRNFRHEAELRTWLYRIAVNTVRSGWRRQKRRPSCDSLQDRPSADLPSGPDDQNPVRKIVQQETIQRVKKAISELKQEWREVIVLRDIEGLTYAEVAGVLDVPEGTVKSRLARGRDALRERLAGVMRENR
jgi:RNA polymerase sigma-70 factor (ECF subfamily)